MVPYGVNGKQLTPAHKSSQEFFEAMWAAEQVLQNCWGIGRVVLGLVWRRHRSQRRQLGSGYCSDGDPCYVSYRQPLY